jgi:hypothetical protein
VQAVDGVPQCVPLPSLALREPVAEIVREFKCPEGHQLEASSYTAARCVECAVVTPSDNQLTWQWNTLGVACAWACRPELYKYFRKGVLSTSGVDAEGHRHVDCVTWAVYEALSRDPSKPITIAETQKYFANLANRTAGAHTLRAVAGALAWSLLAAVLLWRWGA